MNQHKIKYYKDYKKPDFTITECKLEFIIDSGSTRVENIMHIVRLNPKAKVLRLDGEKLDLELIWLNDELLEASDYRADESSLELDIDSDSAVVRIINRIYPDENSELEGLYRSNGLWCTQNEPEGFRKITYFIDRPDVMAKYSVKIIADCDLCPILLSNGNLVGTATLENNRHLAMWEDPYPKPSYLFALVAGDLGRVSDEFITRSGKKIELNIYVDKGNESKCTHAMKSLKNAMEWDEYTYNREYDLSLYNIVAVDSFNMGAMENKGLNVFNSAYVLADSDSATDNDFLGIESVIAHEYFHNYTGNRITCRNWFELTLKEGLTVFRDQSFSGDMNSFDLQRISDVRMLRERQFVEDSGPTAHPIKPDSYMEINNFYTATIYEKGAEVIRMLYNILTPQKFYSAMEYYFREFDGMAIGTDEFLEAMQSECDIDLTQFRRWYHQERTPTLKASSIYDESAKTLTLNLSQKVPNSVKNTLQLPYAFGFKMALLDENGDEYELKTSSVKMIDSETLYIDKEHSEIIFTDIPKKPYLSLNRDFSVPCYLECDEIDEAFLMRSDKNGFNRYEAAYQFGLKTLEAMIETGEIDIRFIDGFGSIIDLDLDEHFKSELLELPSISAMLERQEILRVDDSFRARESLKHAIALEYKDRLIRYIKELEIADTIGKRALKNRLLSLVATLNDRFIEELLHNSYYSAKTMTERLGALQLIENYAPSAEILEHFYMNFKDQPLVVNKYLAVIASSHRSGVLERIASIEASDIFDIKVPNMVRALIGSFARNHRAFYTETGLNYIASKVIELDGINPQIASSLAGVFKKYSKLDSELKSIMGSELERIKSHSNLSDNVYEIVDKILLS